MSENLIPAQQEGSVHPDFYTPVMHMCNDALASGDGLICNELVSALGSGIATMAGMFATPEMADLFMERFFEACMKDAKERYDTLDEARSVYGAMEMNPPASPELH